eukprot:g1709.t1
MKFTMWWWYLIMEGWMLKRSRHLRKWNRRYFRLRGRTISYYTNATDLKPRNWHIIRHGSSIQEIRGPIKPRSRMSILVRKGKDVWKGKSSSSGSTTNSSKEEGESGGQSGGRISAVEFSGGSEDQSIGEGFRFMLRIVKDTDRERRRRRKKKTLAKKFSLKNPLRLQKKKVGNSSSDYHGDKPAFDKDTDDYGKPGYVSSVSSTTSSLSSPQLSSLRRFDSGERGPLTEGAGSATVYEVLLAPDVSPASTTDPRVARLEFRQWYVQFSRAIDEAAVAEGIIPGHEGGSVSSTRSYSSSSRRYPGEHRDDILFKGMAVHTRKDPRNGLTVETTIEDHIEEHGFISLRKRRILNGSTSAVHVDDDRQRNDQFSLSASELLRVSPSGDAADEERATVASKVSDSCETMLQGNNTSISNSSTKKACSENDGLPRHVQARDRDVSELCLKRGPDGNLGITMNDNLVIRSTTPHAHRLGVRVGHQIVEVDGHPTATKDELFRWCNRTSFTVKVIQRRESAAFKGRKTATTGVPLPSPTSRVVREFQRLAHKWRDDDGELEDPWPPIYPADSRTRFYMWPSMADKAVAEKRRGKDAHDGEITHDAERGFNADGGGRGAPGFDGAVVLS